MSGIKQKVQDGGSGNVNSSNVSEESTTKNEKDEGVQDGRQVKPEENPVKSTKKPKVKRLRTEEQMHGEVGALFNELHKEKSPKTSKKLKSVEQIFPKRKEKLGVKKKIEKLRTEEQMHGEVGALLNELYKEESSKTSKKLESIEQILPKRKEKSGIYEESEVLRKDRERMIELEKNIKSYQDNLNTVEGDLDRVQEEIDNWSGRVEGLKKKELEKEELKKKVLGLKILVSNKEKLMFDQKELKKDEVNNESVLQKINAELSSKTDDYQYHGRRIAELWGKNPEGEKLLSEPKSDVANKKKEYLVKLIENELNKEEFEGRKLKIKILELKIKILELKVVDDELNRKTENTKLKNKKIRLEKELVQEFKKLKKKLTNENKKLVDLEGNIQKLKKIQGTKTNPKRSGWFGWFIKKLPFLNSLLRKRRQKQYKDAYTIGCKLGKFYKEKKLIFNKYKPQANKNNEVLREYVEKFKGNLETKRTITNVLVLMGQNQQLAIKLNLEMDKKVGRVNDCLKKNIEFLNKDTKGIEWLKEFSENEKDNPNRKFLAECLTGKQEVETKKPNKKYSAIEGVELDSLTPKILRELASSSALYFEKNMSFEVPPSQSQSQSPSPSPSQPPRKRSKSLSI